MLRFGLGLAAAVLAASGCSVSQNTAASEAAVSRFHELLNAGSFDEIYASSSPELKAATSQRDFTTLLEAVHRKLGDSGASTKQGWNVNYHTSGTFVSLSYKTSYAQGEAVENFVYRVQSNVPALVTYNVNSGVLLK